MLQLSYMNNLEYLNHISQSNRPVKPVKQSKITGGLIAKILAGGVLATAILIAVGILMNSGSNKAVDVARQLYVRMDNVNKTISTFNKSLKSSQLRSINASLSGTLTATRNQLGQYLSADAKKGEKPLVPSADVRKQEEAMFDGPNGVNTKLTNAKLNGRLDRYYSAHIHLQVSLMMSMCAELLDRDHSSKLREIIEPFYSNLTLIEQTLDNYNSKSD